MFFRTARRQPYTHEPLLAESAKVVVDLAGSEAARLRHSWVGTEHVALGLLQPGTRGCDLLVALGASPDQLRARIEAQCPLGKDRSYNLPFTSRVKKIFELAVAEAGRDGATGVEAEYLLLGLLLETKGLGAQVFLSEPGISVAAVRNAIQNPGAAQFRVVLSDASDASLTEQIQSQISEAIATGQLKPGDRLQPVRSLADELNIAPGTVARAYTELEKRGRVRTDGVRGTMVADRVRVPLSVTESELMLSTLLRPVAVKGFHLGVTAEEMRNALERAMSGVRLDEIEL